MKIYIKLDGEGITGVVNSDKQANPGGDNYQEMRRLLMSDLNAAIEGAIEGGASEVIVYDMHHYGLNVIVEELHPKAKLIAGNPHILPPGIGLDETYKGMIMIGYHVMADTEGGLLTHTYSLDIKSLYLNEILMGEIGLEAAIAGTYGVPLIMISGDSKAIEEGEKILGDFEKAMVKYALDDHSALCLPTPVTKEIIKEKVKSALVRINEFKPYIIPSPYQIKMEFYKIDKAGKASTISGVRRINDVTVELKGNNLFLLWESFQCEYSQINI